MTPERLAEIRDHDAEDQHWDRGHLTEAQIERRELLAEVDRLNGQITAVKQLTRKWSHRNAHRILDVIGWEEHAAWWESKWKRIGL